MLASVAAAAVSTSVLWVFLTVTQEGSGAPARMSGETLAALVSESANSAERASALTLLLLTVFVRPCELAYAGGALKARPPAARRVVAGSARPAGRRALVRGPAVAVGGAARVGRAGVGRAAPPGVPPSPVPRASGRAVGARVVERGRRRPPLRAARFLHLCEGAHVVFEGFRVCESCFKVFSGRLSCHFVAVFTAFPRAQAGNV